MPRNKTISDEVLLASCRETFLVEGVGVSTKVLASSAGVSEGVLFQRFRTKDDLFFASMHLPAPDLSAALGKARDKSTEQGLTELAAAAFAYLRAQMPAMLLVVSHPAYLSKSRPAALLMDARSISEPFHRFLSTCDAKAEDPEMVTQLIVSALLARAMHESIGVNSPRNTREWLRRTVRTLVAGLR